MKRFKQYMSEGKVKGVKGKPVPELYPNLVKYTRKIKIYRGLPDKYNEIDTGDFVALTAKDSEEYAITSALYHGEHHHALYAIVNADEVYDAKDSAGFIYDGKKIKGKEYYSTKKDKEFEFEE